MPTLEIATERCPVCIQLRSRGCAECGETSTLDGYLRTQTLEQQLIHAETAEGLVINALDAAIDALRGLDGRDAWRAEMLCREALERLGVEHAEILPETSVDREQRMARGRMEVGA